MRLTKEIEGEKLSYFFGEIVIKPGMKNSIS